MVPPTKFHSQKQIVPQGSKEEARLEEENDETS